MKFKSIKTFKDIDVVLFRNLSSLGYKYRVRIYLLVFLLGLREVLLKTPYLNIIVAGRVELLNVLILPLAFLIILGFESRKLISVSLLLFVPTAILTLLGRETLAEYLGNTIYLLLSIGVVMLFVDFIKKNE